MQSKKHIVVTRPLKDQKFFDELTKLGFAVFHYPTIEIRRGEGIENFLGQYKSADWVVFTSSNGVSFFLEKLDELGETIEELNRKKVGVVGERTKEEVEKNGVEVSFIPSRFTTENLGKELPIKRGEKVFLPRAGIATPLLAKLLESRGAEVFNIPIYQTEFVRRDSTELEKLLKTNQIALLTFTSPSTVQGFMEGVGEGVRKKALDSEVLSIGPVTTRTLKKYGFKKIHTAEVHTTEGMIEKLKKSMTIRYND